MNIAFDPLAAALRREHSDLELQHAPSIDPREIAERDTKIWKLVAEVEHWKCECEKNRLRLERLLDRVGTGASDVIVPVCSEVIRSVSRHFHVSIQEMKGANRKPHFVLARHVAMYLIRKMTLLSFPQIARHFNDRDHTTIMHAYDKISEQRKADPSLNETLIHLEREIQVVALSSMRHVPLAA